MIIIFISKFRVVKCLLGNNVGAVPSAEGGPELWVWWGFRVGNSITIVLRLVLTTITITQTQNGDLFFSPHSAVENFPVSIFDHPQTFTSIAGGPNHLLALTIHGDIYSWDIDEDSRLGHKPAHTCSAGTHPAMPSLVLLGLKRRKQCTWAQDQNRLLK